MIGFIPRRRGLFGTQPPMQSDDPRTGSIAGMIPQPAEPTRRGFLGIKGLTGDKLATLGSLLLGNQNAVPNYFALQDNLALKQAQREQEWQDFVRKQEYEAAHPKPVNNDTVADYEFIRQNLGEDAGKQFLQNKANPPQYRQGPDGNFYRIDTSGAAPPTAPVGKLTIIPEGGTAGNGGGNFPNIGRYYGQ